jgi:hypothetical protein
MARPAAIKGTPEQRAELRRQRSEANRRDYLAACLAQATNGRERVQAMCQVAKAIAKSLTEQARNELADGIRDALLAVDVPEKRRESA